MKVSYVVGFMVAIYASFILCAPETREHYLQYKPGSKGDDSIIPEIRINKKTYIMSPVNNRYYTSVEIDYTKIKNAKVLSGPRDYGCYITSEAEPYRSEFFKINEPLKTRFANKYRKDLRCFALLRPQSDVALSLVLPSGVTGMVVVDGNKGYSSLKASAAMYSLLDIGLVQEPTRGLRCRIDLEDGSYVFLDAQTRSRSRLSGISRIGCSYFPPQGRFIFDSL